MSGPLRRIKRSRPADAGEPTPEGRAAETEGAATPAETPPPAPSGTAGETRPGSPESGATAAAAGGADPTPSESGDAAGAPSGDTAVMGAAEPPASAGDEAAADKAAGGPEAAADKAAGGGAPGTASGEPGAATTAKRARRRPFRRRSKRPVQAPPPVLLADPNVPAGVDPAEVPMRPPAGRRGRLRRRLRYLRRARELMLRDLGGLLYEIHRTGGGNVEAHATVVGAKVQRIAGLDAEAHALETALAASRGERVMFEPGVGGTCAACGELYGSDARFCSNCGTPIGAVVEAKAPEVVGEPARRSFWRRAAKPAAGGHDADAEPRDEAAAAEPGAAGGETRDEPRAGEAAADRGDDVRGGDPPNPYSGLGNGRPDEERKPSVDPLLNRERS